MNINEYCPKYLYIKTSVLAKLWNLQDNCQFYQNFFRTFLKINQIFRLIFIKFFQDNLRNRGANILRPVPSWITKTLKFLTFKYFGFEHTWWWLFQNPLPPPKLVMQTKFYIYVFIILLQHLIYSQTCLIRPSMRHGN